MLRFIHIDALKNIFSKLVMKKMQRKHLLRQPCPARHVQEVARAGLAPSAHGTHTPCASSRASSTVLRTARSQAQIAALLFASMPISPALCSAYHPLAGPRQWALIFFFVHDILNWFLFGNWQCPSCVTYFLQAALVGWDVPLHRSKMGYIRL